MPMMLLRKGGGNKEKGHRESLQYNIDVSKEAVDNVVKRNRAARRALEQDPGGVNPLGAATPKSERRTVKDFHDATGQQCEVTRTGMTPERKRRSRVQQENRLCARSARLF